MRQMMIGLALTIAFNGALADDNDWVYTPETHVTITPTTAEGTMAGLDARARGFDIPAPTTVDKWYWTSDWITGDIYLGPGGMYLFFR